MTGTLTVYFENSDLYNKFNNDVESLIDVRLDDPNGVDFIRFQIPAVKFSGATPAPPASGPVPLTMPFIATLDSVTGTNFIIQRSNV